MLVSTMELITLAASNSLIVFCFCNLIIVLLLVSAPKPSSQSDQEGFLGTSSTLTKKIEKEQNVGGETLSSEDIEASLDVTVGSNDKTTAVVVDDSVEEDEDENGEEEEKEDDDDELRRRVEEFIDKVNRGWKAEMLLTSHYVHAEMF
ncbi:PREDICTED: nucleolin-like [Nelumbo nucifera]|uniref:Uncharacterized protein n=2 Tax=Nelumbo nucifera TaxID=4432 RepID=A0A822YMC2_NELNU|nr:PREDICTED: nucleolin-like [Nelumbo nucifera]DAD33750.1 TPA_asm: hypothetical protein HUJ06_012601 [Nelumbo nucifera]